MIEKKGRGLEGDLHGSTGNGEVATLIVIVLIGAVLGLFVISLMSSFMANQKRKS